MKNRIYSDNDGDFPRNGQASFVVPMVADNAQRLRPLSGEIHVIRLEQVIRARRLINGTNYPSWDVLAAVAGRLAGILKPNCGRS